MTRAVRGVHGARGVMMMPTRAMGRRVRRRVVVATTPKRCTRRMRRTPLLVMVPKKRPPRTLHVPVRADA